ncbi:hypothetical protein I4U23_013033 [Adineta vaga]|nr:hypothetical protein I4U23_013033 [Adineta vaga]
MYTMLVTIFHTQTLLGDLYGSHFQTRSCIFLGNVLIVISSTIYMASVSQAFYRLFRVVYPKYRCLQHFRFYIILPFIQIIVSVILVFPLLLWNAVIYLPSEHYCFVSYTGFRSILWAVFSIYIIPIACIFLIYIRITIFIKKANNQTIVIRRRQERDVLAIQRILTTVGLLALAGAPAAYFLVRLIVTGQIHPLTYRVAWLAASISMVGLSVTLIFSVPQLKSIILKNTTKNQKLQSSNDRTVTEIEMKNILVDE